MTFFTIKVGNTVKESLNFSFQHVSKTFITFSGEAIRCFVGDAKPSLESVVDCDTLGIQREELYCRNITEISGKTRKISRECVAMSW